MKINRYLLATGFIIPCVFWSLIASEVGQTFTIFQCLVLVGIFMLIVRE